MSTPITINDTTLRDGEQTAGVAFTHAEKLVIARAVAEAVIHVGGLFEHRANYRSLDPAGLGGRHRIALGKHSGSPVVVRDCRDPGIGIDEPVVARILPRIREFAARPRRPPVFREPMHYYLGGTAGAH